MSENKMIYGLYDDDGTLVKAAKEFVGKGVKVKTFIPHFRYMVLKKLLEFHGRRYQLLHLFME